MAEKKGFDRRSFLKILGAGASAAAVGCTQELPEKLIPYVIQPDEVIPGIASWYAGACRECPAGCGIMVRTREGRAVKIEGKPEHPINKGGLCAIGQSALQGLYDPDRVREPLLRKPEESFAPTPWTEAIKQAAAALNEADKNGEKIVFITKPLSGSEAQLIAEFKKKFKSLEHISFSFSDEELQRESTEQVFGEGLELGYDFSKADVILGVGADYLATWNSPVEHTRGFSEMRKPEGKKKISKVYHLEPRLSLTAANADSWLLNTPGKEAHILEALLQLVLEQGKGLSSSEKLALQKSLGRPEELLKDSGVSLTKLRAVAKDLLDADAPLVVAGGSATLGSETKRVQRLGSLLNAALGALGKTVQVRRASRSFSGGYRRLVELFSELAEDKIKVSLLIHSGVNPVYLLPREAKAKQALAKVKKLVAIEERIDETSRLAHIVLPLSAPLESWWDDEPRFGVWNLNQPAMAKLYETQGLGDTLLSILGAEPISYTFEGVSNYYDYLRRQWKERLGESNFEQRWTEAVQQGGVFEVKQAKLDSWKLQSAALKLPDSKYQPQRRLALLAYPTVHSFDGSTANRPWLQEVPDPITTAVWGTWVELHPQTAKENLLSHGQVIQVRAGGRAIEAPAFVTEYIHPGLVAMPLGQGHQSFGRYANGVGANPLSILPLGSETSQLLCDDVELAPSIAADELVITQGHDSQLDRGILRSVSMAGYLEASDKLAKASGSGAHSSGHEKEKHGLVHHDPHALGPKEEPKQMYEQMPHVLYRWAMAVDTSSCVGCSACVTACYAENNIPVVGKDFCSQGREMSWVRVQRFFDENNDQQPVQGFMPMMCQHCGNAPCEPVCPVYATYHNDEGLNAMIYNRCVGTRYCSNNCSYKVRRFNWFHYTWPEPLNWQLNPDVTVRSVGVMEKCSFCIQRIKEATNIAKDLGRPVQDGEIKPACASSCPAEAIAFGNLEDPNSKVAKAARSARSYRVFDVELNTQPAVTYLAKVRPGDEFSHDKKASKKH